MTIRAFTIRRASGLILAALWVFAPGSGAAAAPCFTAVDAEPLGTVADDALVLHAGWRMRESAIVGGDGVAFSRPGFHDANWYETSVPATPLGVLVRHGIYPDPYVGVNNLASPTLATSTIGDITSNASATFPITPTPGPVRIGSARNSACRVRIAAR